MKPTHPHSETVLPQDTESGEPPDSSAIARAQAGLLRLLCTLAARRWIDRHSPDPKCDDNSGKKGEQDSRDDVA